MSGGSSYIGETIYQKVIYIHVQNKFVYISIDICMYMPMQIHIYMPMHRYMNIYIYIYAYMHIYEWRWYVSAYILVCVNTIYIHILYMFINIIRVYIWSVHIYRCGHPPVESNAKDIHKKKERYIVRKGCKYGIIATREYSCHESQPRYVLSHIDAYLFVYWRMYEYLRSFVYLLMWIYIYMYIHGYMDMLVYVFMFGIFLVFYLYVEHHGVYLEIYKSFN
jgi:hypothetical protein